MRVVVAGAAGGTGATTVAALLAHLAAPARAAVPVLVDRTGGTLAARTGEVDATGVRAVEIADIGPLTTPDRWESFVAAGQVPVLTASMTPSGIAVLSEAVHTLARHAPSALARTVLVATGAGAGDRAWLELARGAAAPTSRYALPRDGALARGGALRLRATGSSTRRLAELMARDVASRLAD